MTAVLLFDDERSILDIHSTIIDRQAGMKAYPCHPDDFPHYIEELLQQGIQIDVVVADYTMVGGPDAHEALKQLFQLMELYCPEGKQRPKGILLSSGADNLPLKVLELQDQIDFADITFLKKPFGFAALIDAITEIDFGNASVSRAEASSATSPSLPAKIRINDALRAFSAFREKRIGTGQLRDFLRDMDPEELLQPFYATVAAGEDDKKISLRFAESDGNSLSGIAAFSWDDVMALKQEYEALHQKNEELGLPTPPRKNIIMISDNGDVETIEKLPLIAGDGLVLLGPSASHFKLIATRNGVASCLVMDQDLADERKIFLRPGEGTLVQEGPPLLSIKKGDAITIDTGQSLLYKAELPVSSPMLSDEYRGLMNFIRSELGPENQKHFSYQIDGRSERERCDGPIGLIRMENFFLPTPPPLSNGRDILLRSIGAPEKDNLHALKNFTKAQVLSIFEGAAKPTREPVFRMMDFKPDQIFKTPREKALLEEQLGLSDLRGFTPIADRRREIYEAQIEGLLEAAPTFLEKGSVLRVIVPDVKSPEDLKLARKIIDDVQTRTGSTIRVALGAMIESVEGVEKLGAIFDELAKNHPPDADIHIGIGGSDLATDLYGGIERHDHKAIADFMERTHKNINPFQGLPIELKEKIREVAKAASVFETRSKLKVSIHYCGAQVKSFSSVSFLDSLDITPCVPAAPVFSQGFSDVLAFMRWKNEMALRSPGQRPTPTKNGPSGLLLG